MTANDVSYKIDNSNLHGIIRKSLENGVSERGLSFMVPLCQTPRRHTERTYETEGKYR